MLWDETSKSRLEISFQSSPNVRQSSSNVLKSTGLPVRKLLTVARANPTSSAKERWLGKPLRLSASLTSSVQCNPVEL